MPDTGPDRPPLWFKIAAVAAVLWGLAGVYACYSQLSMNAAQLAALPAAQGDAFTAMPLLVKGAYVVAVVGGLIGGMLLLVRKAPAGAAFIVSLIGIVVQFGWIFGPYQGLAKLGPSAMAFPAFVTALSVAEVWLSSPALKRGWIG